MAEKLKSGSWRVRYDRSGQRFSKSFPNKDAAQKFEAGLRLNQVEDILQSEAAALTFGEFANRWLREYCEIEKAESQWKEDRSVVCNHLNPAFGSIQIGSLRKSDLNEVKLKLQRSKKPGKGTIQYAPKTINNILGLAKKMMNTAVDWELIPRNPFSDVKKIKVREQDFAYWTPQERDQFLAKCYVEDADFADAVLVACHTGLRLGELAGLTWNAVDFHRKTLAVKNTFCFKLKKGFSHTKTHDKAIHLPINELVAAIFLRRKNSPEKALTIFPLSLLANSCKRLQNRCRRYDVKPIRFHDLRHTFASCLAMAGVDLMVIKDLMRHKSYQMTLRYAHLHPDHLLGATDVLTANSAFRGQESAHANNCHFLLRPRIAHEMEKGRVVHTPPLASTS